MNSTQIKVVDITHGPIAFVYMGVSGLPSIGDSIHVIHVDQTRLGAYKGHVVEVEHRFTTTCERNGMCYCAKHAIIAWTIKEEKTDGQEESEGNGTAAAGEVGEESTPAQG